MFSIIVCVVLFHVVLFTSLIMMPGCRTSGGSKSEATPSADIVMPPTKEAIESPYVPPAPPPPRTHKETVVSAPKEAGATEYVVQKGDTLGSIAHKFGLSINELKEANKIKDANKIRINQKLIIPATGSIKKDEPKVASKETSAHKSSVKSAKAVAAGPNEYIVQPGDSLSKIAAKHGVKVSELKQANNLTSDKVKINQKLKIPEKSVASAKPKASSVASNEKGKQANIAKEAPKDVSASASESATTTFAPAKEASAAIEPASPSTLAAQGGPAVSNSEPQPAASAVTIEPQKSAAPSASTGKDYSFEHIVRPDDDLNKIARMYATKVEDIIALNNLGNNTNLTVGQKIKIPNL